MDGYLGRYPNRLPTNYYLLSNASVYNHWGIQKRCFDWVVAEKQCFHQGSPPEIRLGDIKKRGKTRKIRTRRYEEDKKNRCLFKSRFILHRGGGASIFFSKNPSLITILLHVGWVLTLQLVARWVKPLCVTLTASYWGAKKVCGLFLLHTLVMVACSG